MEVNEIPVELLTRLIHIVEIDDALSQKDIADTVWDEKWNEMIETFHELATFLRDENVNNINIT